MVYRRKGSSRFWVTVPHHRIPGEYVHLPTRTRDAKTAEAMGAMVISLGPAGQRKMDVLDWLFAPGRPQDALPRLYDHWLAGTLDQLRAELGDRDLAPGIAAWDKQLEDQYRGETPRKYRHHIAALFPREGKTYRAMPRSRLVAPGFIAGRLAAVGGSRTNRRRHLDAWVSCGEYLVEHGYLETNPMRAVKRPKPDRSTVPHIERYADVLRLVKAFPKGAHRAAAALREGAGMEMQAVLAMRAPDVVDVDEGIVWAHGGKNVHRDRQVIVDAELFGIFLAYYRSTKWMPHAPLFPFTAEAHRDVHNATCETVRAQKGVDIPLRYTPHAARHTYAVRAMKAGVEPTIIASNLGHADATMVMRLYGKYRAVITDLRRAGRKQRESAG